MGRPSDSLLSAIKWFDFLSSFLMLSIGCCVCVALIISPTMLMSPPIMIGIVAFGLVIPMLFKTIEMLLIQGGLHDSWGLVCYTMLLGICFVALFIFTLKSYVSFDTIFAIKDNIPKIQTCLDSILKEQAANQFTNQFANQSNQFTNQFANQSNQFTNQFANQSKQFTNQFAN